MMDALLQDLRYAVRTLRRMRGTAITIVLTLAAGIAATTVMASAVYAALYRPMPFEDPDRLVMLYVTRQTPREGLARARWPWAKIQALQRAARSFDSIAPYTMTTIAVGDPDAEQLNGEFASANYLRTLRVAPSAGRWFTPDEEAPGHPVVVLSEGLWRRRFGPIPFTQDRHLVVNSVPLTVVGLLPDAFRGLSARAVLWLPIGMAPQLTYRDYLTTPQHFIAVVARLDRNVPLARANEELAVLGRGLPNQAGPTDQAIIWGAVARPLGDDRIDPATSRSMVVLLGAVGCVLLVTCVNVAALLLARARVRRREVAVRLALGARRARIVRQLLTETGLLAAAGGGMGVLLAAWGLVWLRSLTADVPFPHTGYIQVSSFAVPAMGWFSLVCALVLSIATAFAAGLAPAWHAVRDDAAAGLAEGGRSATSAGQTRTLRWLAASQIAIAVLLVAGALLLLATFARLQQTRVGFDPAHVLTFWVTPPGSRYSDTGAAVPQRVLESVERVPGVTMAALNRCTPFGSSCARTLVFFPGRPTSPQQAPTVGRHYVSADYFRTLGIRVVRGRPLTSDDRAGRPPVTVINETAARRLWPNDDPIGQRVWFASATGFTDPAHPVEVVGVVADVKYWPVTEPPGPDFYTSYLQFAYPDTVVMIKAAGDPLALVPSLRAAVASVDSSLPIYDVRTLDQCVDDALWRPRFNAALTGGFAVVTVLLAAMGIFGVIAYGVSERRREFAVRIALGSTGAQLRQLVIGQAARLAVAGTLAGVAASWALLRLVRGLLYDVAPADPTALGAAAAIMIAVALIAGLGPAARAARTDPLLVLRSE